MDETIVMDRSLLGPRSPVGAGAHHLVGGLRLRRGARAAQHHPAREDGGLATVVVRHLRLRLIDEDTRLPGALPAGHLESLLRARSSGAVGDRHGGAVGASAAVRQERVAGAGAGGARPGVRGDDGGDGGGRARGRRDEVGLDGSHPSRLSHLIGDHGEQLFFLAVVSLQELLCKRLAVQWGGLGLNLGHGRRGLGLGRRVLRPNSEEFPNLARIPIAEANRDAPGVHEEVKLDPAESGDPVGPFNVRALAGVVDGAGRSARRGEGQAAPARAAEWLSWNPGRSELSGKVCLKRELQLDDGRGGVADNQGAREVGDDLSEGEREGTECGSGSGHCGIRVRLDLNDQRKGCDMLETSKLNRPAIDAGVGSRKR